MKFNVVYNKEIKGFERALDILEEALIQKRCEFKSFELDNLQHFGDFTFVCYA